MYRMKKWTAFILSVVLLCGGIPGYVYAEEPPLQDEQEILDGTEGGIVAGEDEIPSEELKEDLHEDGENETTEEDINEDSETSDNVSDHMEDMPENSAEINRETKDPEELPEEREDEAADGDLEVIDGESNGDLSDKVLEETDEAGDEPLEDESEVSVFELTQEEELKNAEQSGEDLPEEVEYLTDVYINPLYADVMDESDLVKPEEDGITAYNTVRYHSGPEDAGAEMRSLMQQRVQTIVVGCRSEKFDTTVIREIAAQALIHTGNPIEGDYIRWQFGGYTAGSTARPDNGSYLVEVTYTVTYYTTAAQEQEMDTAVQRVRSQLNLSGKSDYVKVRTIFDYLCDNVQYDYDNLENDDYKLKHTAYAALINKKAVCQGYAVLFYRLALEEGIDTRLIAGQGVSSSGSEGHAWNIVRINGLYYNVDATWGKQWFLLCDAGFSGHIRDAEYATSQFQSAYPMAAGNYTGQETDIGLFTVQLSSSMYTYDGTDKKPSVTVKSAEGILRQGVDYRIAYQNNRNAGTASVVITGIGNYTGKLTKNFRINPRSVSSLTISTIPDQSYTGNGLTPVPAVKDGGTVLTKGVHYNISYQNNVQKGTATIIITGRGNYTGSVSRSFKIVERNGLQYDAASGNWYMYKNGRVDTGYTGVTNNENGWWYVKNGVLDWNYTGVAPNEHGWWYIRNGALDWNYTGVAPNEHGWWYIKNGQLDWSYTGVAPNEHGWWYIKNGALDWSYTGVAPNEHGWWYIKNGQLDWSYTGVAPNEHGWWYIKNGALDWNYTGVAPNENGWWYIRNGALDWSYTGVAPNENGWWYIKNGALDWSYTGVASNENGWGYIKNGALDWSYTGLASNENGWWYIRNGALDWNFSGNVYHYGHWYSVRNGCVQF